MTTKYGFGDNTQGTQRAAIMPGGLRVEVSRMDMTDDVSASNYIPTTFQTVVAVIGHACCSLGCVSGTMSKGISYWCVSKQGQIDVSIGDFTVGGDSAELNMVAFGY